MRTIKSYIGALLLLLAVWSCEKEGDLIIVSGFENSQLSSNVTDIILTADNQETAVLAFSWTESTLSLSDGTMKAPASIPSVIIEASTSVDFENVTTISPSANPHIMTGLTLNTLAKNLQMIPGESASLYFRANAALGKNTEPKYSEVISVAVTPYSIDMSKGYILNRDKEATGFFLYSPDSDGEYHGFMNATGWMGWYLREGDATTWGNLNADGNEFILFNDEENHWNLWFPGLGGAYFATLSTTEETWTATYIPTLNVEGDVEGQMTFDRTKVSWLMSFTTTADNAQFSVSGPAKYYDKNTSTEDEAAIDKNFAVIPGEGNSIDYSFTDAATAFTVPTAGEYTLEIFLGDPTNLNYTITTGSVIIEDPISEYLYLPGIDNSDPWNFDQYIRLVSDLDSTFAGVVNVASEWGYIMSLEVDEWTEVYNMGATEGTLLFKGENNITAPDPGLTLIQADLKNLTYSHTPISQLGYSGLNDDWTGFTPMTETASSGTFYSSVTVNGASASGIKIYLNNNWDLFFGGDEGTLAYGANGIPDDTHIATGTYDLIANLTQSSYVFLGDEVYITGLNNVWDFSSVVLTKTEAGIYTGTAIISSVSPDGFRIQLDDSWSRYYGGSFESLTYLGDNLTDDQNLAAGTYNVTLNFITNTCSFELAE
ncbi:MAG: DUF5114 domain-containing protein [Bacteroidales bacterium]|nr:DUF5114 domain-containing protein [Bacteroidales bacterium]